MNKGEIPWHLPRHIGLWRGYHSECNQGNLGDGEETGEEAGTGRGILSLDIGVLQMTKYVSTGDSQSRRGDCPGIGGAPVPS